jgi:hypothetical protein
VDRSGGATPRMLRAVPSGRSPSLKHLTAVARPEEPPRARCTDEDSGVFNAREKSFRCRPAVRSRFRVYRRSTFHFRFSDTAIPLKETQIARRVLSCARARARGSLRITADSTRQQLPQPLPATPSPGTPHPDDKDGLVRLPARDRFDRGDVVTRPARATHRLPSSIAAASRARTVGSELQSGLFIVCPTPGDRDRPETTSARERLARNAPVSTRRTTRSAPDAVSSRDICR